MRTSTLLLLSGLAFLAYPLRMKAQYTLLDLPRESQRGTVMQRIGTTDMTVDYSRPSVKGRTIWGEVVPYGEVWRAGANENTTFTTTHDLSIGGKTLPAGTYGLHISPTLQETFEDEPRGRRSRQFHPLLKKLGVDAAA